MVSQFLYFLISTRLKAVQFASQGIVNDKALPYELYGTIPDVSTAPSVGLMPNMACAAAGDLMLPNAKPMSTKLNGLILSGPSYRIVRAYYPCL